MKIISKTYSKARKALCGDGKLYTVEKADGTVASVTRSTYCRFHRQKAERDQAEAELASAAVLAGYSGENGCFIGTVTKVSASHKTVTTRGGVKIKLPHTGGEKCTFAEWDATLAAQTKYETAPRVTL